MEEEEDEGGDSSSVQAELTPLTQPLPHVSMDAKQSNADIVTAELGERFTVQEMKVECKRRGLHGYSALTRNRLIDFLASDIETQYSDHSPNARASRAKRNGNQICNQKSKKSRRSSRHSLSQFQFQN